MTTNIFVLVHGNNGSHHDFDTLENILNTSFKRYKYHIAIIKSKVNEGSTKDGIEKGGSRLASEILNHLLSITQVIQQQNSKRNGGEKMVHMLKLSLIGHSLGGLFCRYAIPFLVEAIDNDILGNDFIVEFVSFVTICTPHLGSRRPKAPRIHQWKNLWRFSVHQVLSLDLVYGRTGKDLLLEVVNVAEEKCSNGEEAQVCLLEAISKPGSKYMEGLHRFCHRTLVSLVEGDYIVPFSSSSIRRTNPYKPQQERAPATSWHWSVGLCGFESNIYSLLTAYSFPIQLKTTETTISGSSDRADSTLTDINANTEIFQCDDQLQVEFLTSMLQNLQSCHHWRRMDLQVVTSSIKGRWSLHDWPIGKNQDENSRAKEFIYMLAHMLLLDHCLEEVLVFQSRDDVQSHTTSQINSLKKSEECVLSSSNA